MSKASLMITHLRDWSYGRTTIKYDPRCIDILKNDRTLLQELSMYKKTHIRTDDDIIIYHWWIGVMFGVVPNQLVKV